MTKFTLSPAPKTQAQQQGFTLIELLVALGISTLILAGIGTSFAALSKTKNLMADYNQLEEDLSFISQQLSRASKKVDAIEEISSSSLKLKLNSSTSCVDMEAYINASFEETYSIVDNKLKCTSLKNGKQVTETLAYNLESLSFECAFLKQNNDKSFKELEFESCPNLISTSSQLKEIAALKFKFKFSNSNFLQLKQTPEFNLSLFFPKMFHENFIKINE